jgi:hypothetical protein
MPENLWMKRKKLEDPAFSRAKKSKDGERQQPNSVKESSAMARE